MGWRREVTESLATIKADTTNHNGELQDFKKTFYCHVEKEEARQTKTSDVIDEIKSKLTKMDCPYNDKIDLLEASDKDNSNDIASLKISRKYTLYSFGALYTLIGVILKKVFMV